jgi:hypothetical protein
MDFINNYQNNKSCIIVDVKILGIEKLNMNMQSPNNFQTTMEREPPSLKKRQTTQIGRVENRYLI